MRDPAVRPVKLQVTLARAGYGSRRTCEQMIRDRRVSVDGVRAKLGDRADPRQQHIEVDGERLRPPEALTHLMLNKPPGVLSSATSQGGWPTVLELVEVSTRVYPVGRLDLDSEGLILLTNDGMLAQRLTHPSYRHEKEYRVLLHEKPREDQLRAWREGLTLERLGRVSPARVWLETSPRPWLRVVLMEGKKRQIRETALALGLKVDRLLRVRIAALELGDLPSGKWRHLSADEVGSLRGEIGI